MALQPVNRRSVPEDVFDQIVAEVLSGEMQPGESLPSEHRGKPDSRMLSKGSTRSPRASLLTKS